MARNERNQRQSSEEENELKDKLIAINRVAKVVKGGRRFSFAAIVVVGDHKGRLGIGFGKAGEVPEAIRKATHRARSQTFTVPIIDGTIPHEVVGHQGAGRILLKPASPGTGVIAGPVVRAVMDVLGVHNLLTKSLGSTNPHNMVRAVKAALQQLESPAQYALRTNHDLDEVMSDYTVGERVWGSAH